MNKQSTKKIILATFLFMGLTTLSGNVSAQAYLPGIYVSNNYVPIYNGPVVSQTVAYTNNNQIAYTNNNQIYTGFGGGTVVSNTYNNNSNNYNNYSASNNSEIYAIGNQNIPIVSGSASSNTNSSQNENSAGLSVDTYSSTNTGITASTQNGGFSVLNPHTSTTVWFEYGESSSTLNQKTVGQSFSTTSGSFSKLIYGLKANTTYFARAVAQHGGTIIKGDIISFKTSKIATLIGGTNNSSSENNNDEVQGDNTVVEEENLDRSNLGALAFWSGFFPNSALGWIIIIIIILIIILLARRYRNKNEHNAHR